MKKNKGLIICLISFLALLTVAVTVAFVILLRGGFNWSGFSSMGKVSKTVISEKQFNNIYDSIAVSIDRSKIEVKESSNDQIEVVIYGDKKKDRVRYSENRGNLNIEIKQPKCRFFCINQHVGRIVITVPNNYSKKISIKNDVGDIDIGALANLNVDINTDVGDVDIKEIQDAKVTTDVGDIDINKIYGKLTIDTDVGDVDIDNAYISRNSKITTDVGDVKIKKVSGINIDAKSDVGDKEIKGNAKNSNITLKITTDVGDIKVN